MRRRAWLLLGAAALATLLGFCGGWLPDLFSHFRAQYALLALLCLALLRSPRALAVALPVVGLNVGVLFWVAGPLEGEASLRLVLANVNSANQVPEQVAALVRAESPAIVGVIEPRSGWLQRFEAGLADYPHRFLEPHDGDNFGLALYSQLPFEGRLHWFEEAPVLEAVFEDFTLVLMHPPPPMSPRWSGLRDRIIAWGASLPAQRLLIAGDLNATPWSAPGRLLTEAGFHGFGRQPTWPDLWWLSPFLISIDHVLGRGLRVVERRVGPSVGSDHRPLIVGVDYSAAQTP